MSPQYSCTLSIDKNSSDKKQILFCNKRKKKKILYLTEKIKNESLDDSNGPGEFVDVTRLLCFIKRLTNINK